MGTGYTRIDTANNIADGNVINAQDFDDEFDGIVAAFDSSSGHTHDGTAAEGAPITKFGPSQEVEGDATALFPASDGVTDLGKSTKEWKDLYIDGVINTDDMSADAATITGNVSVGGTLNVGSSASYTGAVSVGSTLKVTGDTDVSNLSASGTLDVAGNASIGGTFQVTGEFNLTDVSASGTLDVAGNGSVGGTLVVTGDTDITNVSANGTLDVSGNASVGGTLVVTGDTDVTNLSANGTLDVSGNGSVGGTFNVEGDLKNSAGNLTIAATSYIVEVKGGGSTDGAIQLNCSSNSHGQTIKAQDHSAGVTNTMLLPRGASSVLVSEIATQTLTNKTLTSPTIDGATIDTAVSVSSAGTLNAGTNADINGTLDVGSTASVGGALRITDDVTASGTLNIGTNASVTGTLNITGSAGLSSNVNVGGTLTGASTVSDQDGDLRDVSKSGASKSTTYTLADGDQGNFIQLATATAVAIIPDAVFSTGDIVSVVNTGSSTGEISCTITSAIIAGADASTATMALGVNGVASILFLSNSGCIVTGNIS